MGDGSSLSRGSVTWLPLISTAQRARWAPMAITIAMDLIFDRYVDPTRVLFGYENCPMQGRYDFVHRKRLMEG
jgi:hypothetical protein